MIVVKIKGGLGNQLFQYAFGRSLSIHFSTKVYFDVSDYNSQNHRVARTFDLDFFKVKLRKIESLTDINNSIFLFSFGRKKKDFNYFIEKSFSFDSAVFKTPSSTIFDGYWQSFKYFETIKSVLQTEIVLKKSKLIHFETRIRPLNGRTRIAVHLRRGDYVTDSTTFQIHGVCDTSYYQRSINYFRNHIENAHFFLFSDDISSVKEEFGESSDFTYVDFLENHLEEFEFMKKCDHFIISNSTFSWWAAWLSIHAKKQVIAPARWFNDPILESQTNNLIPIDWKRL
jgi:hypothetical protein